jgi:hypothetical protein
MLSSHQTTWREYNPTKWQQRESLFLFWNPLIRLVLPIWRKKTRDQGLSLDLLLKLNTQSLDLTHQTTRDQIQGVIQFNLGAAAKLCYQERMRKRAKLLHKTLDDTPRVELTWCTSSLECCNFGSKVGYRRIGVQTLRSPAILDWSDSPFPTVLLTRLQP